MDHELMCEKFIAADKIINGEYYDTMTMGGITNYPNFNKYCPNSNCETDMKLNGLSEDLFNQLGTQIEDEYYEYFMMWLSDKLFKIVNEDDNSQINDITLNEAYDKYLKKNIENRNYWILLDIKKGLKEANLKYMEQFYKLLNNICNAIVYYNSSEDDTEKFISISTGCSDQYSSLYNSVPKCDSYLHLLDNLKKTYEGFKNTVHDEIKKTYPHLEGRLQTLTIENTNSYFVEYFKAFDFSDSKCKLETKLPPQPQPQNGTSSQTSQMGDSDKGKENSGGTNGNKRDPSDPASSTLGGYFDWRSSFHGFLFDRTEIFNKSFQFIDKGRQTVKEVTNKISSAYSNTVGIVKGAYDKTVTTVKNAYTTSTNYISGAVSSITNQLSSFGTFQLGDNKSGSNSLGGGVDTSDQSQPKSTPSLQSLSPSSSPSQTTSDPQTSSDSPSLKSLDPQPIPTYNSKCPIQQIASTDGNRASQISLSAQGTLPSSSTDPSTQGNGSTTGTVVKMNEKSSIWCIAQNNKCDIMGISIIVISISIILTIIYKYLSLGCTSKSKRKKNVKKVINSIGGKRPVQIIIKSVGMKKMETPVINPVREKKKSLLNIYKLMQADPAPFINLFFLLIFFVCKRKLNYLEL
ncbi:PIR protein CIR protein [Plasmodium vinckei lentum]|uniref:PIR protein CIR protein n=1 Tax=Plasmodium vinckei lentum TaxID=138297 RepID=A0A6V7RZM5_PLAVN|nr:PIR protein CIR protein [Plasmodium vinckei lentum]